MMEAIVKGARPLPSPGVEPTRRTRRALLLLAPILLVAVVAGVISFSSRGDAAFVFEQQHPRVVSGQELEALVGKAPEPTPNGPGNPAAAVRCVAGSAARERNPWRCTARYRSGHTRRYVVNVRPDGSYRGQTPTGRFEVSGCCVATPSQS
jgi:hypothetical protein